MIPGGKGINVARALKRLGEPVIATGLAGGRTGSHIVEELTAEGILNDFVRIRGRVAHDHGRGRPHERRRRPRSTSTGPRSARTSSQCCRRSSSYLSGAVSTVVLAGSLPRRCRRDLYAGMISRAARSARCAR